MEGFLRRIRLFYLLYNGNACAIIFRNCDNFGKENPMERKIIRILALALVLTMTAAGVCAQDWWDPLAVERQIYACLTEDLKLSPAAACGILANIEYESAFQVTIIGDQGTSFGLCQWHNERYSALMTYCTARGLDYQSVEGQMEYMAFELKSSYVGLYGSLRSVDNSPEGAYQAAYLWCIQFERPADMERKAEERGNSAKYKYWNRYNSFVMISQEELYVEPEEIIGELTQDPAPVTIPQRIEYVEEEEQGRRYVAEKLDKRYYTNWHGPREMMVSNSATGFAVGMLFVLMGDGVDRKFRMPAPVFEELGEVTEEMAARLSGKMIYTPVTV